MDECGEHGLPHTDGQIWRCNVTKLEQAIETGDQTLERLKAEGKVLVLDDGADDITTEPALEWFYGTKERRLTMRNLAPKGSPRIPPP